MANITLDITPATQYATAYVDGHPVATAQRRRIYQRGPAWKLYRLDGGLYCSAYSETGLRKAVLRMVRKAGQ